ncbi:MAG TPA: DNA-processing protein DprA, partial [Bacillota bacterium]|nr:DNA-processing protein DprA [Bacillota bacterium]
MDNTVYCVWLSRALGAANHIYRKLFLHFGNDPIRIYKETVFDGLDLRQGTVEKLLDKDLSEAIEICGSCERSGIKIAVLGDGLYPKQLESIPDRPYVLYMKGKQCDLGARPCVAIVGTRNATPYGKKTTRILARELAGCSAVIVSGLAYGIDSEAHRGCLEANGYTVAVLGCGHDRARRWDNGELLEHIARSGMIISEYPPQMPAAKYTFPQRNRIISGLSRAVVVAQAGAKSGALITADYAVKQGRRLYTMAGVPGDGDYAGC